jgi:ubiquinone/menaquinone biosynthesis C-methylase UbiE
MSNLSGLNLRAYERKAVALKYQRDDYLFLPERVVFKELKRFYENGRILDIGVGGGRTTPALLDISDAYHGVDYSSAMVEAVRKRFPGVKFSQCDARDLSCVRSETIDLAIFSFNGIDYVGHADRLQILKEIKRVLTPNGAFFFATHNRNQTRPAPAWHPSTLGFREAPTLNPLRIGHRLLRYLERVGNVARLYRLTRSTEDYAILVDSPFNYRLLTYYISVAKQIEQLKSCGFEKTIAIGGDGKKLEEEDWHGYAGQTQYLAWPTANSISENWETMEKSCNCQVE